MTALERSVVGELGQRQRMQVALFLFVGQAVHLSDVGGAFLKFFC